MPNGRKKTVLIDRPDDIAIKAQELKENNCRLEIEMLRTGQISMTVEQDLEGEQDPTVLAQEICANDPTVPIAVDKLISEASAKLA